mgnify:CR=1 FL=1
MGIFDKKDDMGNKGRGGRGPKPMHRGRKYDNVEQEQKLTKEQKRALDSFHETGSTDHHDYDMGEYEKSYGPNKYGHPEKPAGKMKMPHAAQMRMNDMVAKVYGSPMPPSQQRDKTKAEKKQEYTTYGMPDNLYTEQGEKINTAGVDEGNLSAIRRVHKLGEHVTVEDDTERFGKGTKLFLKDPTAASKYKMPASMKKHRKGGKAEAVKNTPKKPMPGQRP